MHVLKTISLAFRLGEFSFAVIVAGITGYFLSISTASTWDLGRFIYIEVVALLSIIFSTLWAFQLVGPFSQVSFDVLLTLLWAASFGLLVQMLGFPCEFILEFNGILSHGNQCGTLKADVAFSCISLAFWLVSVALCCLWGRQNDRQQEAERKALEVTTDV